MVNAVYENSSDYDLDYEEGVHSNQFFEYIRIKKLNVTEGPIISCGPGDPYPAPNMTLGIGPGYQGTTYVEYDYHINDTWDVLTITRTDIGAIFLYHAL
jgi:hypothetical protein